MRITLRSLVIGAVLGCAIAALVVQWPEYQENRQVIYPTAQEGYYGYYYVTGYDFSGLAKTAAIETVILLATSAVFIGRRLFRRSSD